MSRIWSSDDECFDSLCVCVKGHRGRQKHLQSSSGGQRPGVRRKCHLLLTGQIKQCPSCFCITPRVMMTVEDSHKFTKIKYTHVPSASCDSTGLNFNDIWA